jgi:hypothetical protein
MPVHPLLLQLNENQVLLMAIIAPLSSSLINERLRHFHYPKIKADEPSLMLRPHARVRSDPCKTSAAPSIEPSSLDLTGTPI